MKTRASARLTKHCLLISVSLLAIGLQAALTKYDDFSNPTSSAAKWNAVQYGTGTVNFGPGQALLSLSNNLAGSASRMEATNFQYQMTCLGDAVRITWDMQIRRGGSNAFQSGIYLGDGYANGVTAGQLGQQNGEERYGPFMQFFPHTADQNLARGFDKYHYDVTATLISTNGTVSGLLNVYTNNPTHEANPDAYASEAPIQTTSFRASIAVGAPCTMIFYVGDPLKGHGDCCGGDRGSLSIGNVFTEVTAGASRPVTPITNTAIYTAVELALPTEWNAFYKIQWTTNLQSGEWSDFGPLLVGTGAPASVFDSTRPQPNRYYRVLRVQ